MRFELDSVAEILRLSCGVEREEIYGHELIGYIKTDDTRECYVIRFDGVNGISFVLGRFENGLIQKLRAFAEHDLAINTMVEWAYEGHR